MSKVIVDSVPVRMADGTVRHRVFIKQLSEESKDTGYADGSELLEKDTGKRFEFDAGTETWYVQPAGGGATLPSAEGVSF